MTDSVAQCFDRHSLAERLKKLLTTMDTQQSIALIFIDVKHTRQISAHYGFRVAEEILSEVANELGNFKKHDAVLLQSGLHEFALILPHIQNSGHCQLALNRIEREVNNQQVTSEQVTTKTKIKLGASLYPTQAEDIETWIQNTEIALHHAEMENLTSVMFSHHLSDNIVKRIRLESELDLAIHRQMLELWYQPKLDLISGKLFGVEALARWKTRGQGYVSPEVFIRLAEERGFIFELTRWAFNTAFRHQQEWSKDGIDINMAVNLSGRVIEDEEFVDLVMHSQGIWGSDPGKVTLEVTETSMMESMAISLDKLNILKAEGYCLSIDDFGTGYSSLEYFKHLPVDELKIDKSFIKNMLNDAADQSVVSMVVNLARTFDMSLVAEGIEDEETLTALNKLGVDKGQGFFIAKPMPETAFRIWAKDFMESTEE